jgi:hypothetical protein
MSEPADVIAGLRAALGAMALLVAGGCGGMGDPAGAPGDAAAPDGGSGAGSGGRGVGGGGGRAGGGGAGGPGAVTLRNGIIPAAAREQFCVALAGCNVIDYDLCLRRANDTATVLFALPACAGDERLLAAMNCVAGIDFCTSSACDAAVSAWADAIASLSCEVKLYSIGIGDAYPEGASDSVCDGGLRVAGGWCGRACAGAADTTNCAGNGPDGRNHFGTPNVCAPETYIGGWGCYPGCSSTVDCKNLFGDVRNGRRIACMSFSASVAASPICVRMDADTPPGTELP